jgi:hypothetical protein
MFTFEVKKMCLHFPHLIWMKMSHAEPEPMPLSSLD